MFMMRLMILFFPLTHPKNGVVRLFAIHEKVLSSFLM